MTHSPAHYRTVFGHVFRTFWTVEARWGVEGPLLQPISWSIGIIFGARLEGIGYHERQKRELSTERTKRCQEVQERTVRSYIAGSKLGAVTVVRKQG